MPVAGSACAGDAKEGLKNLLIEVYDSDAACASLVADFKKNKVCKGAEGAGHPPTGRASGTVRADFSSSVTCLLFRMVAFWIRQTAEKAWKSVKL